MQALLILGNHHHRYNNSSEIVRLQHEEILARGREVQSLKQRLAEVEDLLVRRDADVEKKIAELEGRTDELERWSVGGEARRLECGSLRSSRAGP